MRPTNAHRTQGRHRGLRTSFTLGLCFAIISMLQACSSPAMPTGKSTLREIPVVVIMDGSSSTIRTSARSVGGLLQEHGLTLGPRDAVHPNVNTSLSAGSVIQVTRRVESTHSVLVEVPYETIRRADAGILAGQERELQEGTTGAVEVTRRYLWEDGAIVGVEQVEERLVQEPVSRILAYGTGGVVSRGGQDFRYRQVLEMRATGYTAGKESNPDGNGYTYTGVRATRGIVAVDPRVIPLHTRLYVEGYGPAVAADIGGAIKGAKIDLCFDTVAEALEWGVRPVRVYVLD